MTRLLRLLVLLAGLAGSLVLLFGPTERMMVMEGEWREVEPAPATERCPSVDPTRVRWRVEAPKGFQPLALGFREALGVRCAEQCLATHEVTLSPSWVEEPGFFSGYAVLDVPLRITRRVGECTDTTRLRLDVSVDQGRRGKPWIAAATAGRVAGNFSITMFAEWHAASTTTSKAADAGQRDEQPR